MLKPVKAAGVVFLLTFLAFGVALAQPMRGTYTVKPVGGDFPSIAAGVNAVKSRGLSGPCTLLCYTGTYTDYVDMSNFTPSYWLTIRAAPGERPYLNSTSSYAFYMYYTNRVKLEGLLLRASSYVLYMYYSGKTDSVIVQNCSLFGASSYCVYFYNCKNIKFIRTKFAGSPSYGIYGYYDTLCDWRGCYWLVNGSYGLYTYYGHNLKVENCTTHATSRASYNYMFYYNYNGVTFRNNYQVGGSSYGLYLYNSSRSLVEGNHFSGSYSYPIYAYYDTATIYRNNLFVNTGSYAFYGYYCQKQVVEGCSVGGPTSAGFYLYYTDSLIMRDNIINAPVPLYLYYGNGYHTILRNQFYATSSYCVYLYGSHYLNRFINNFFRGYTSYGIYSPSGYYLYNPVFKNNSFYNTGSQFPLYLYYAYNCTLYNNIFRGGTSYLIYLYSGSIDSCNFNCYYTSSGTPFYYNGSTRTWAQWQGLGFDLQGKGPMRDPSYVNPPLDLHLRRGSCCIDSGKTQTVASPDIDGEARTLPHDIGADEWYAPVDLAVQRIISPGTYAPLDTVVTPQAVIYNYGPRTVSNVRVDFRMRSPTGKLFQEKRIITTLASGDSAFVTYTPYQLVDTGDWAVRCTLYYYGDSFPSNNIQTLTCRVPPIDVSPVAIEEPVGSVDFGSTVTPKVWVKNLDATYPSGPVPVDCYIGTTYYNRKIAAVPAGESLLVEFDDWIVDQQDSVDVMFVTLKRLDPDMSNDTIWGRFWVDRRDVGTAAIVAPKGNWPSGVPFKPKAWIKNYGNTTESFDVLFTVSTAYQDSQDVSSLAPGESILVEFTEWTPDVLFYQTVKCSTRLATDMGTFNDKVQDDSVFFYLIDAQPTLIIQPKGEVDSGTVIAPQVRVKNNGTWPATFYVRLRIVGTPYNQQRLLVNIPPGVDTLVTGFPNWVASPVGEFEVRCSTALSGEMIPTNDLLIDTVKVRSLAFNDVGVNAIIEPAALVTLNTPVRPRPRVRNYGTNPATFDIHFVIKAAGGATVYQDSLKDQTLDPGRQLVFPFPSTWTATPVGNYQAIAYTVMSGDGNPANDTFVLNFRVTLDISPGWSEEMSVLGTVKDGGWLAVAKGATDQPPKVYASPGYKSNSLFVFDLMTRSWSAAAIWPNGREGKPPSKGACACYGDGYIYAVKGNNTPGFWRYSVAGNTWEQLADIPAGNSGRNPRGGTDVAYVKVGGTGYVYLLKGYGQDFMRYNTETGAWELLPNAPAGSKPKWDRGSWIACDGDNLIYTHKAKYHEFWVYSISDNAWSGTMLQGMPIASGRTGKNKKSKDGADAAYYNEFIYALKGGNTVEFWKYDIAGNTWTELDPMPEIGSSGRRKMVKNGGALVCADDGLFYAFKGGKTAEFWRYFEAAVMLPAAAPERSGVMAERTGIDRFGFSLAPNPLSRGYGVLSYSVPQSGEARLTVYDVTGRAVFEYGFVASGTGTRSLDLRSLSAGVYLVRFEAAGTSASQKLIVE
ncbi:MAG: right-handed parallel beta-helix repeat-containing protein [candidate division WOR-3 bacterium]